MGVSLAVLLAAGACWPHGIVGEPTAEMWNRMFFSAFLAGLAPGIGLLARCASQSLFLFALLTVVFSSTSAQESVSRSSQESDTRLLESTLKESSRAKPLDIYQAAEIALRLDRLEDAGYLYNIGRLRVSHDSLAFPPNQTGGDSPTRIFEGFNQRGIAINPYLMDSPDIFGRVIIRLKEWKPETPTFYSPGWDFGPALPDAENRARLSRNAFIAQLEALLALMQNPEYLSAYRVVKESMLLNRGAVGESSRAQDAVSTMRRIEHENGVRGVASQIPASHELPILVEPSDE